MRLVYIRGGMKNVSTSLEMEVSVLIAPHQTLVNRACQASSLNITQQYSWKMYANVKEMSPYLDSIMCDETFGVCFRGEI